MVCKKCDKYFKTKIVIDGKERNLNHRKFCLDCSPFGQHNTRDITKPSRGRSRKKKTEFICKTCKKARKEIGTNAECGVCRAKKRRTEMKEKAIKWLGGKCKICGYHKCYNAFDIHHVSDKSFDLSNSWAKAWEKIEKELENTVLLCCRCHREVHAGMAEWHTHRA